MGKHTLRFYRQRQTDRQTEREIQRETETDRERETTETKKVDENEAQNAVIAVEIAAKHQNLIYPIKVPRTPYVSVTGYHVPEFRRALIAITVGV